MKHALKAILTACLISAAASTPALAQATRVSDVIWAHGSLYSTIVTPAGFVAPPAHSTDTLYNFAMSGLAGQRPISEAAPGDRDYNGGRWSVKLVVFTEQGVGALDSDGDGTIDFELTRAEQIIEHAAYGNLRIVDTTTYFECPLLR